MNPSLINSFISLLKINSSKWRGDFYFKIENQLIAKLLSLVSPLTKILVNSATAGVRVNNPMIKDSETFFFVFTFST